MTSLGPHMAREAKAAAGVFAKAVVQDVAPIARPAAIYTFARGSSDAVANILSFAFMHRLGIPMTSMPPSVFSLGNGVMLQDALALIISQSGASDDLVACAKGAPQTVAITNVAGSAVAAEVQQVLAVGAGVENAVPATKTVIGSIGAGMALLAGLDPTYRKHCLAAAARFQTGLPSLANADTVAQTLASAQHIYVLGRQAGFGVAQEVALKLKETCALHAEAYSASEVLHGPLQLSTKPLTVLSLDTCEASSQPSLAAAEAAFRAQGASVVRVSPADNDIAGLEPPAMAAALLYLLYPIIHRTANILGLDPDAPKTLQKVTRTR